MDTPWGKLPVMTMNLKHTVPPNYPREMRRLGISGAVVLLVLVGETGASKSVVVTRSRGSEELGWAAAACIHQWRFPVWAVDGKPASQADLRPISLALNDY